MIVHQDDDGLLVSPVDLEAVSGALAPINKGHGIACKAGGPGVIPGRGLTLNGIANGVTKLEDYSSELKKIGLPVTTGRS